MGFQVISREFITAGINCNLMVFTNSLISAYSLTICSQVLLFGQSFFITLIPTIMGLLAGVAFAGASYPFGIVLFISIVPIILSVDHFTRKASQAGLDKAITDAKVAGKIASAVECRKAIRASNAGDWVSTDMKDLFDQLRCQTKNSYFRSDLARNFLVSSALLNIHVYSLTIARISSPFLTLFHVIGIWRWFFHLACTHTSWI